jgi:hypothetical protein
MTRRNGSGRRSKRRRGTCGDATRLRQSNLIRCSCLTAADQNDAASGRVTTVLGATLAVRIWTRRNRRMGVSGRYSHVDLTDSAMDGGVTSRLTGAISGIRKNTGGSSSTTGTASWIVAGSGDTSTSSKGVPNSDSDWAALDQRENLRGTVLGGQNAAA